MQAYHTTVEAILYHNTHPKFTEPGSLNTVFKQGSSCSLCIHHTPLDLTSSY